MNTFDQINRNKEIIKYYLFPHSLRETGDRFNLTYEAIRLILCKNNIPRHKYQIIPQMIFNQEIKG